MRLVAMLVVLTCGVMVGLATVTGYALWASPMNRYAVGALAAVGVVGSVVWLVLWIEADREAKVSTPSLLFIWFWLCGLIAAAYRWAAGMGGGRVERSDHVELAFGLGLLAFLTMVQMYLRRRWRIGTRRDTEDT